MNSCDSLVDENKDESASALLKWVNEQASVVIWIFSGFELEDNVPLYINLYAMFYSVQTYQDTQIEDCAAFVRAYKDAEFVVIVSTKYALRIIPHIYDLKQLHSIYIYDLSNNIDSIVLYSYAKTIGVYKTVDHLFHQLADDINHKKFSVPLGDQEYNQEKALKTLVDKCRSCYSDNQTILKHLEELECSYDRNKAIYWYTRDSFLFRLVNKALRTMNIEVIFNCHFIIVDICKASEEEHEKLINEQNYSLSLTSMVQYCRGQRMSRNELDQLKLSIDEFVIVKIFFISYSGSLKGVWVINLSLVDENDQRLLNKLNEIGYQHLSELSFGTQIIEVGNLILRQWSQMLSLLYYNNLLREHSIDDPTYECACYAGLGWNVFLEENYELALADHAKALERSPSCADKRSEGLKATILNQIGKIYEALGSFELALQSYTKAALDLDSSRLDQYDAFSGFPIIPSRKIAKWHRVQSNFDVAMEIYNKIVETKNINHFNGRMSFYREIARASNHVLYGNDDFAHIIQWTIFNYFSSAHYLPEYYNEIAQEYYFIGNTIREYNKSFTFDTNSLALKCYRKCVDILSHYAPKEHRSIAECYDSIAKSYVTIGSNEFHSAAIEHYEKALLNIPSDT
ncbi:unnamed protein product [Rotaria socialis]|uniref:Uncharacterized protein n=3 Tax=Rotaria socialis TaxID=392032 RepID=A0A821KTA3_9BILA|nr:unnamed protein product [Rotaria socialis]CAF4736262.1 unnamed protein product [Rotaria socialis]